MVDICLYGFRPNKVYIPKPRIEDGMITEIPFISLWDEKEFIQVTVFFDSYEDMQKILKEALDKAKDAVNIIREQTSEEGEKV